MSVVYPEYQSAIDKFGSYGYVTHDRHLLVAQQLPYGFAQIGRLLLHDDIEGSIAWTQQSGTVAKTAGNCLTGSNALKLTAAAGAGNQAVARKLFPLPADQSNSTELHLLVSGWFQPVDANWRDIQVVVRPDDSVQRREAGLRYIRRFTGVAQNNVQYEDSGQIFQNVGTYAVRDGGAAAGDPWHFFMLVLNYKQGTDAQGGYLKYHFVKFDDLTSGTAGVTAVKDISAAAVATNSFREMTLDLIVTGDNASAAAVLFDEIIVSDIAGTKNIL